MSRKSFPQLVLAVIAFIRKGIFTAFCYLECNRIKTILVTNLISALMGPCAAKNNGRVESKIAGMPHCTHHRKLKGTVSKSPIGYVELPGIMRGTV